VEDLYRVETTLEESGFQALAQMQSDLYQAERNRRWTVIAYVFIASGAVLFALLRQSAAAFLPVIIGCWLLIWQRNRPRAHARQMAEGMRGRDPSVLYRFSADGFHIRNAQQEGKASYRAIVNAAEDDRYYFLFINEATAHLLRKADFTLGDPAAFAAFIEDRTGLKVTYRQRRKISIF